MKYNELLEIIREVINEEIDKLPKNDDTPETEE